jgi:hypothetical protein
VPESLKRRAICRTVGSIGFAAPPDRVLVPAAHIVLVRC